MAFEPWHWRFIGDSESWAIFGPARALAAGVVLEAADERRGMEEPPTSQEKAILARGRPPLGLLPFLLVSASATQRAQFIDHQHWGA